MARKSKVPPMKTRDGLDEPFPSAPQRPGEYTLYVRVEGLGTQVFIFAAAYAARKMFDAIVEDDELKQIDDEQFETSTGIVLRSHLIDQIADHEYTPKESEWQLPDPYPRIIERIRAAALGIELAPRQSKTMTSDEAEKPEKAKADKPKRQPKRKAADGAVTIAQIADELGMSPREARGILRSTKTKKPEGGWAWPANKVDSIKKLLEKNRK